MSGHSDQQRSLQDLARQKQKLTCCAREKCGTLEAAALGVGLEREKMEATVVSPQLTGLKAINVICVSLFEI